MSESGDYVTKQQRVKVVEWNGPGDHPDVTETGPGFYSLGRGPSWPGVPVHEGCYIVEYEETGYRHVVSRDELLKRYRRVPRSWRRVEDVERACEVLSRHKFAGIDDWKAHVIGYGNVVAATMIDWPGKTITVGDDAACEIAAAVLSAGVGLGLDVDATMRLEVVRNADDDADAIDEPDADRRRLGEAVPTDYLTGPDGMMAVCVGQLGARLSFVTYGESVGHGEVRSDLWDEARREWLEAQGGEPEDIG